MKNRQKLRYYKPKYTLGGPGRPPQPEFASKIGARRANLCDNWYTKPRFCVFFTFFFVYVLFPILVFFEKMALFNFKNHIIIVQCYSVMVSQSKCLYHVLLTRISQATLGWTSLLAHAYAPKDLSWHYYHYYHYHHYYHWHLIW